MSEQVATISQTPPSKRRRRSRWPVLVGLVVIVVLAVVIVRAVAASEATSPVATGPDATAIPATPTVAETTTPPDGMPPITVQGNQILRGGVPWWFLGYNSFTWSGNCGSPQELMSAEQVDEWFASMRHDGHGAVRLFFFDGWDVDRLDAAIAAAARNNVYVTITLDNALADCGEDKKTAEWFRDQSREQSYIDHMTSLLERYRGNPTIAWFEYFNEPGWQDGGLLDFIDRMHPIATAVDPDRLFSSGTLAPYAVGGTDNFLRISESPGVDIVSLHEYDFAEGESHLGPPTRENAAGKPVIVGEFGVIDFTQDAAGCEADVAKRADRVREKAEAYIGVDGYVGAFAWAWQPGTTVGACGSPGIDQDRQVQELLRTITR